MEAIRLLDHTHLVPLSDGQAVMVGAPPEGLKIILLWEYPSPNICVLPPDPLFAHGINQASFEFLMFNYMFRAGGLRDKKPFIVVCDPVQKPRVDSIVRDILRGPSEEEMAAYRTPISHRRQLAHEMVVVAGPVAHIPAEQMARVVAFTDGVAELPDGVRLRRGDGTVTIEHRGDSLEVERKAQPRSALPLYFADVKEPIVGSRFGIQVIGSASGFSGAEWSSSFIVWINGQALLVDGTPYLEDHLTQLGVEDDLIVGHLITHAHEDHANVVGSLVGRRKVTLLTSPPVMASLVSRLSSTLAIDSEQVRKLFHWVPLQPGLDQMGPALQWYGSEIRTWYSVHPVPTLGVEIRLDGQSILLPGDTLWGKQLDPLLERGDISRARYTLVQHSYQGGNLVIADAGGPPIHPDPQEVREFFENGPDPDRRILVTHCPDSARGFLQPAEPGMSVTLIPREERISEQATALYGSPLLRDVPERWLLTLLYGSRVVYTRENETIPAFPGATFVLMGSIALLDGDEPVHSLERGDLFHRDPLPEVLIPQFRSTSTWTCLLQVPEHLYQSFLEANNLAGEYRRLNRTRRWWQGIVGQQPTLETLADLARLSKERSFRSGVDVVKQGDRANYFYIVTKGSVEVIREVGGERHVLGRFGSGYHFGELAILAEERRTATVRTLEATDVLELPAKAFLRQLLGVPHARYKISSAAEQRLTELRELLATAEPPNPE